VRALALDLGKTRTGYCLSDPGRTIPSRSGVLVAREREALIQQVSELVKREDVDTVVVGVPYGLNGSLTPQTSWVLEIIDELRAQLDVSLVTLDERLTTREAQAVMRKQGISTRDKEAADEIAARLLLETYLRGESD